MLMYIMTHLYRTAVEVDFIFIGLYCHEIFLRPFCLFANYNIVRGSGGGIEGRKSLQFAPSLHHPSVHLQGECVRLT